MPSKPFKIGDRIVVYADNARTVHFVKGIDCGNGGVYVDGRELPYHPKQCRRLRPRKERRSVWIHEDFIPEADRDKHSRVKGAELGKGSGPNYVPFVEVRRRTGR